MTTSTVAVRATGAGSIAAVSQGLGLVQLFLLLNDGAGAESDAYFYLLAWVTVPIQLVLMSTLLPVMLRRGVVERRTLLGFGLSTVALTVALAAVGTVVFARTASHVDGLVLLSALLAVSTVASVPAWTYGLALSATGAPEWLSGVNLLPSAVAVPALVVVQGHDLGTRIAVMLVAQAVGFALYGVLARGSLHREGRTVPSRDVAPADEGRGWFLGQGVAAYASILTIQTAATALPTSGLTILGVVVRVVSAGTGLVTNAVLPLLVNTRQSSVGSVARYARTVVLLAPAPIVLLVAGTALRPGVVPTWLYSVPFWVAAVLVNAALHRIAFATASPRLSLLTILGSPVVAVVAWLVVPAQPTLTTVLACFVALELVSALPFALVLGLRRTAWLLVALGATYGTWLVLRW